MKSSKVKVHRPKVVAKRSMKKRTTNALIISIIVIAVVFGTVMGSLYAPPPPQEGRPPHIPEIEQDPHNYLMVIKTTITVINITISLILIVLYVRIYREVRSDFTIGLIVVMFTLLLYSVTSNPLLLFLFGYHGVGMGLFMIIPDMFSTVCLATLLYLSLK
jgi:NADH:ubiquinone oxidoreductase subunit 5 (subunit L)/multisubunit Na+/H+ antiporter MnhA subunit